MTQRGAEALRAELKRLKSEARPHVIKAITEARGHGDLAENAEYHAAREQQGFIEGRIKDIEHKLANAEVIEVRAVNQVFVFDRRVAAFEFCHHIVAADIIEFRPFVDFGGQRKRERK